MFNYTVSQPQMKILKRKKQKLEVGQKGQKGQNTNGNYGIISFFMTVIVSGISI